MKNLLILPLLLLALTISAQDSYQIGDKVENFSLKNIDGKMVSMEATPSSKGYILIFTCNHCPYSKMYEDRIIALDLNFKSKGYPVIAINPNDPERQPEDSYDKMISRASEKGFTFPYVFDETQEIAASFGATRTPHVFIIQRENEDFVLKYIGAIDDSPRDESAIEVKYVENAIAELEAGKDITTTSSKAIGCSIKWKE